MKVRKLVCAILAIALLAVPCFSFADGYFDKGMKQGDVIMTWWDLIEHMDALKALDNPDVNVYTLSEKYDPVTLIHNEKANNGTITPVEKEFTTVSESGRDLYVVELGDGDKVFWIQAQIHGNEKLTTIGLMKFIWEYATNPEFAAQFADLKIVAIPMYNPDGSYISASSAQRGTNVRNAQGIITNNNLDLNRDWKVNLLGEGNAFVADESRNFYRLWCDVQPDFAMDLHHQGAGSITPNCNREPGLCNTVYGTESRARSMSFGTSLYVYGTTLPNMLGGKTKNEIMGMQKYVFDMIQDDVRLAFNNMAGTNYTRPPIDLYSGIEIFGGVVSGMMLGIDYCGLNPYNYSHPATFFEQEPQNNNNTTLLTGRYMAVIQQVYLGLIGYSTGLVTGDYLDPYYYETYWNFPHNTSSHPAANSASSRDYNTTIYNQYLNGTYVDPITGVTMNLTDFFRYLEPKFMYATDVAANVEKLQGNTNKLTITVTEKWSDKSVREVVQDFTIPNNAAGVYKVEGGDVYKVYVDTKGNTQIRDLYFVE